MVKNLIKKLYPYNKYIRLRSKFIILKNISNIIKFLNISKNQSLAQSFFLNHIQIKKYITHF